MKSTATNTQKSQIIDIKRRLSEDKLTSLRREILEIEELKENKKLCIYVTGSYARLEGSRFSDLDLFFIYQNDNANDKFSKLEKTLIDAQLIKIIRKLEFPDFSGDGEYLNIHEIYQILEHLGGPLDDYRNYFTARMLLLLESKPLSNKVAYLEIIEKILNVYYTDFHDHEHNFKPAFLVNDIIRFWRTLCLNYEHKRHREGSPERKIKSHIKNMKLKFSRKLTCYSFLLQVLSKSNSVLNQNQLVKIVEMSPLERLLNLKEEHDILAPTIDRATELYSTFLERTNIPTSDLMDWMSKKTNRDDIFAEARRFDDQLFQIIKKIENPQTLKYFLI